MVNIPVCICGKPYSIDTGVVLDVTLNDAHERYNFCSIDCIEKRIAQMDSVNAELGVKINVVSKTNSNEGIILVLERCEDN